MYIGNDLHEINLNSGKTVVLNSQDIEQLMSYFLDKGLANQEYRVETAPQAHAVPPMGPTIMRLGDRVEEETGVSMSVEECSFAFRDELLDFADDVSVYCRDYYTHRYYMIAR
jgi:hypothetical protein